VDEFNIWYPKVRLDSTKITYEQNNQSLPNNFFFKKFIARQSWILLAKVILVPLVNKFDGGYDSLLATCVGISSVGMVMVYLTATKPGKKTQSAMHKYY